MVISLLQLYGLSEAVDVADIPVMIIVGHVEGRRAARGSDVATRGGGGATQSHSLSTGHPDGARVLPEEDATTVTKLLAVRLITKGLKIIFCLFVGYEKNQAQELSVDAARGRHARRQKSHMPVEAICVAIIADLVGSVALEDVVRVVGVAELALSLPIVTCAFEIVANGDVYQQIVLPRHADVANFEIGAAVALTREHPLVSGGETSVVTNAFQRPQYMVVCAGPISSMVEAGVDVVPGTFTTHEIPPDRGMARSKKERGQGCW
jgi:hypothetical protein